MPLENRTKGYHWNSKHVRSYDSFLQILAPRVIASTSFFFCPSWPLQAGGICLLRGRAVPSSLAVGPILVVISPQQVRYDVVLSSTPVNTVTGADRQSGIGIVCS